MRNVFDVIIVGGGAAGFFTAIQIAEHNPNKNILILERGKEVLTKVKISGGGRCNVTHAEFIPQELVKNYPRGERELLGPFHQFMTGDTIEWFKRQGVELKIEEDGRMFPVSDSSQTIIDCFLQRTQDLNIKIKTLEPVKDFVKEGELWKITCKSSHYQALQLVIATGSNPKIWNQLQHLNHQIISPVPSLFTFNTRDSRVEGLAGISTFASVKVVGEKLESEGPLLITHWGFSGPGILKLSAWGAQRLFEKNYQFQLEINWLGYASAEATLEQLLKLKKQNPKQQMATYAQFDLPKRLWQKLVVASIPENRIWAEVSHKELQALVKELTQGVYHIQGKSTFKEEFVTAGGVELKEINFKTMESKLHENLFFAGEVTNIDAITGGFNFQNAWTSSFIAAREISNR
ncbi:NAD(P)/FAD-dependent oxidoreductase [Mesonia sp. K4-1]|uniref:NAD(P)/FAD-dependent oxidoreductase n=1 Tax=Mesonia sp. K4-1 TaxID=2602760 RepID=UPI0011C7F052|nr:NAD(P)/FAD-dependent oxidoreductase [Mesonia sp. K4-1]TXK76263.1 NAD(P)/FAD-dependent oxidoreductase [Mesonia sp. K4-1]